MIDIFPVEAPWPAPLAVCMRPRPEPWLHDDLRHLKRSGYDLLVSALTPNEVRELQLQAAPDACTLHGIEFHNLAIGNLGVPDPGRALPLIEQWLQALRAGRGVALHCYGSVGRSPTLAASLLVLEGIDAAEAWRRVEAARGRQVPDTHEQRDWVHALAASRA